VLLRARHLHDPETVIDTCLDNLQDGPGSAGTAEIAGVLVQKTMREKDDLPASPIIQLFCPLSRVQHIAPRFFSEREDNAA
jgi:hypothetical protein